MDLRAAQEFLPQAVHGGGVARAQHHHGLAVQVGQSQPLFARQRVFARDGNAVRAARNGQKVAPLQPLARIARADQKVKLLPQCLDLFKDAVVVVLKRDNVQPVAGETVVDLIPQVHERLAGVQDRRADTEGLVHDAGCLLRFGHGRRRSGEHLPRMPVDHLPGGRQRNAVVGALKQPQVQVAFQGVDLLDDRRGGNVQLFRRAVEAAAVRHADKTCQKRVEHPRPPSMRRRCWLFLPPLSL